MCQTVVLFIPSATLDDHATLPDELMCCCSTYRTDMSQLLLTQHRVSSMGSAAWAATDGGGDVDLPANRYFLF
jgi:hypothetical protein